MRTITIAAQNFNPRKYYSYAIRLKETDVFIGIAGITLSLDKYKSGEIYYEIEPKFWNKGYATEVLMRIIEMGFVQLKLHRIEANTDCDNIPSRRVLEKCGMKLEGVKIKFLPIQGKWKDGCLYAIVENNLRTK